MSHDRVFVENTPAIAGLGFRRFRGESEYPRMVAVILSSAQADRIERTDTVEEIAENYRHLTNCDPYRDMIFAEIEGELVGYCRGWWWDEPSTGRLYGMVGFLEPAWRRRGIGSAMLNWMEDRLRDVDKAYSDDQPRFFQVGVGQYQTGAAALLKRADYQPVRCFYEMVRPTLDDISDWPLPEGLEVRPALPEQYRAIWASVDEASQDEWGYSSFTEEKYQNWLNDKAHFQPHLWQIAWDLAAQRVVGHVLTFIDHAENEKFNRKRGYTEGIGVNRGWRRRGLARALIARSLQAQKAAGMTESALAADSESSSGVTRLYESCGFQINRCDAIYRKPL